MPAVLVVAGGYAAGGATGWALFAAGTMIVSGVMARKAEIDGNKDAAAGWMAMGSIAGVASAGLASSTPAAGATQGEMLAGQTAGLEGAQGTQLVEQVTTSGLGNTAGLAKETVAPSWQDAMARSEARMAEIASNNLKVQAISGGAQALVGWQASEQQKEVAEKKIAEERRLTERQYANQNNLTDLKVQTPTNLPNLLGQARQKGLINQSATQVA